MEREKCVLIGQGLGGLFWGEVEAKSSKGRGGIHKDFGKATQHSASEALDKNRECLLLNQVGVLLSDHPCVRPNCTISFLYFCSFSAHLRFEIRLQGETLMCTWVFSLILYGKVVFCIAFSFMLS